MNTEGRRKSCRYLWAPLVRADGGIVNVNRRISGVEALRIVVHAPLTVTLDIACLHISHLDDAHTILPEGDSSRVVRCAPVERLDVQPAALGNVFDRLQISAFCILIVEIEKHRTITAIPNVQ